MGSMGTQLANDASFMNESSRDTHLAAGFAVFSMSFSFFTTGAAG